ncbi:MAG: hypothetical protein H0X62_14270, partial [Bacteroidetes bacterium]|nr:hypothetical protein [Bacteroidota bacterium]
ADVTTVDVERCKSLGMNDYISKPVDERILYSKIMRSARKANLANKNKMIETAHPVNKFINLEYLNKRTKSNPALMAEMISLYLDQTPTLVSEMKKSFQAKDWKTLQGAVHKMIPSFSIMGISKDFEEMAKNVQKYLSTKQQEDEIPALVSQLENVLNQACVELKEELEIIKK